MERLTSGGLRMKDEKTTNILTTLTEFDICDLKIRCVQVFAETASKVGLSEGAVFDLGNRLWKDCMETINAYQTELSRRDSNDQASNLRRK